MERCSISAATIVGKSFCPHLPVPNRRVSQDAVVDKATTFPRQSKTTDEQSFHEQI